MAKSIKSKRRRHMRQAKRQKNAPKELARLKKILGPNGNLEPEVLETVKVFERKTNQDGAPEGMEVDKTIPKYDKKTKKDKNGHYPAWMNRSKMLKAKRKNKRNARKK